MADNPFSWFLLTVCAFYYVYKFLRSSYEEAEKRRLERERYTNNELIFEDDKRNQKMAESYNRYLKGKALNELSNHRHRNL